MKREWKILQLGVMLGLFLLGGLSQVGEAANEKDQIRETFHKASEAYTQGDYSQAMNFYQDILSSGWESGNVYFNLGNSFYKLGELGKARLAYERALQLIPRDSDLQYNYQFLMSIINETEYDKGVVGKFVHAMVKTLTLSEFVLWAMGVLLSFFAVSAAALYFSWPKKVQALCVGMCAFLLIVSLAGIIRKGEGQKRAIVLKDAPAMFEPKDNSTVHFLLKEGYSVKVVKEEQDWLKIQRPDGKRGWVNASTLETIHYGL